ncbi:hypothetical protein A5757_08605 [Mycobacterium sp. 852013-51886_SCH5428379]|uniref:hypothetical protein n=1 Tax=Mycobacterium sp. 852013-51886_SCH5428379 TaxID=1834111 RepID=UPI0007FE6D00|nr:hypothetical protein [Mycobacterium sp. 852013-51886_SCH5428379]OBB60615.1 hypothetical protein A5757_08605 [Mycobacterium sp. 852013-51886_SCH5428379]
MAGTGNRQGRRLAGTVAIGCAVLCGCVHTVDGAARSGSGAEGPPPPLAEMLVPPTAFPPVYEAVILDAQGASEAVRDIDAIPAGATVEPTDCAPPPVDEAVAARGVDPGTGAALTVALVRTDEDLDRRRNQILRCAAFTATAGEVVSAVQTAVLPPRPVDADDSLASESAIRRADTPEVRMLTLIAQIDDVRVIAALSNDDPVADPDTTALDALFADAVVSVRRGLG